MLSADHDPVGQHRDDSFLSDELSRLLVGHDQVVELLQLRLHGIGPVAHDRSGKIVQSLTLDVLPIFLWVQFD